MGEARTARSAWEILPWDSGHFGFKVGRFVRLPDSEPALRLSLSEASAAGLSLLYLTHPAEDEAMSDHCQQAGGLKVDLKRTYNRAARSGLSAEGLPHYTDHPCARRQLRQLAWAAAIQSRFRVDPRMPPGSWRRLYSIWIARSISGDIADVVLIDRDQETIRGMVTVARRGSTAQIGLFAVGAAHRGQGIGKRLLLGAETWASNQGCNEIEVVTQGTNAVACRAYESAGYSVASDHWVHHFWLEDT